MYVRIFFNSIAALRVASTKIKLSYTKKICVIFGVFRPILIPFYIPLIFVFLMRLGKYSAQQVKKEKRGSRFTYLIRCDGLKGSVGCPLMRIRKDVVFRHAMAITMK